MELSIVTMSDGSECVMYNDPAYPAYARRERLSAYRDKASACHWHRDLEFCLVLEGNMAYSVNGQCRKIAAGQGIFVNSCQMHSCFSVDGGDCESICLLIHPSLLGVNEYLQKNCLRPLMENSAFPCCPLEESVPWQGEALDAVRRLHEALEGAAPAKEFVAQAQAFRLAALLAQHMPPPESAPAVDRRFVALRDMAGYVQRHYAGKISLAQIAAAGNVSVGTCCEIFRKRLGQTPIDYLTRYRLEKGAEKLDNPDLSITEIAFSVGFASASYFSECFKRRLGLTPSDYRRRRLR